MLIWYNPQTGQQSEALPERIRMSSGETRTSEAVTEQLALESGWELVEIEVEANAAIMTGNIGN